MLLQIVIATEASSAELAAEWFLPSVNSDVPLEVLHAIEFATATRELALVDPFPLLWCDRDSPESTCLG